MYGFSHRMPRKVSPHTVQSDTTRCGDSRVGHPGRVGEEQGLKKKFGSKKLRQGAKKAAKPENDGVCLDKMTEIKGLAFPRNSTVESTHLEPPEAPPAFPFLFEFEKGASCTIPMLVF